MESLSLRESTPTSTLRSPTSTRWSVLGLGTAFTVANHPKEEEQYWKYVGLMMTQLQGLTDG